jgi:hypothetical protein
MFSGIARFFRGEWNKAITDFEESRRIAERTGDLFRVYMMKFWEGWAHTVAPAIPVAHASCWKRGRL